jgi:uncharacterized protein YndB with AHSA1/START domain
MLSAGSQIHIEAGQQSVFEALPTAEGWSRWFVSDRD